MALLVYLEPLDTWFFGETRGFGPDGHSYAASGLPTGLTLYGALGSRVLARHQVSLREFTRGEAAPSNGERLAQLQEKLGPYRKDLDSELYRLQGPWLAVRQGGKPLVVFPPPANLYVAGRTQVVAALPADGLGGRRWDLERDFPQLRPLHLPKANGQEPFKPCTALLHQNMLASFLRGDLTTWLTSRRQEQDRFFQGETRSGNHIPSGSWTVGEGFLFFTRHLRFQDQVAGSVYQGAGLALIAQQLTPDDLGEEILYLGGEQRRARLHCWEQADKLVPEDVRVLQAIKERKRFFFYLATPAFFHCGWQRHSWPLPEGAVLVAAAINKPKGLSGWDRDGDHAGGRPRPFYRLAPAGSVYFFEAPDWTEENFQTMYQTWHCGCSLSERYPAGLGVTLVGAW